MGRSYAGMLGLVAFAAVVARGVVHQHSASSTCPTAAAALFLFAALGYVLGAIAERSIASDMKTRFAAEMQRLRDEAAVK